MRSPKSAFQLVVAVLVVSLGAYFLLAATASGAKAPNIITGKAAFADYTQEKPGTFRKVTVADLPEPFATESVDNGPEETARPSDAWPQTLPGFKVELYAAGLDNPRTLRTAPNGDIFVAEGESGRIRVFRGITSDGKPEQAAVFASGLKRPYGLAFYPPGPDPQWLYVGSTGEVVRLAYHNGDLKASGSPEHVADLP